MEIQEINKEKMEALQSLAKTNVAVGEVRGILVKMKAEESAYLTERENKALAQVQKILEESQDTINEAFSNYEEIKKFASDASDFATALVESYKEFQALQETFEEYTKEWHLNIEATEKHLNDLKLKIKIDRKQLDSDKEWVRKQEKNIADEKRKIQSDRGALDRAIKRLKENRI